MLIGRMLASVALVLDATAARAQRGEINIFGGVGKNVTADQLVVAASNTGSQMFRGGTGSNLIY